MKKGPAYYRRLPYSRRCQLSHEGGKFFWHAWVEELPGCEVDAQTKPAAFVALKEVFEDYIATKLEWGSVIPEPTRWPRLAIRSRTKRGTGRMTLVKPPEPLSAGMSNQRSATLVTTAETLVGV